MSEFIIIESENGVTDVEYTCDRDHEHLCSLTWCEENCLRYYSCDRVAAANDTIKED